MSPGFVKFAWVILLFTFFVIAWGAWVRATGAGAGCGSHWPTCNGQVIPRSPTIETVYEYTHRVTSGLLGVLILILAVWSRRAFAKGHLARKAALASVFFVITEGLIGAAIVRLEKVAHDQSLSRVWWMSGHLLNTFILLAFLGLTVWAATRPHAKNAAPNGRAALLLGTGLTAVLFTGVTGAIAALGDTLFPSSSLAEGLARDFTGEGHLFLQLRALHPFVAAGTAVHLLVVASTFARGNSPPETKRAAHFVALTVIGQVAVGIINLLLAAPVFMQLVHLLVADAVWLALIVLTATVAAEETPVPVASSRRAVGGVPAAS